MSLRLQPHELLAELRKWTPLVQCIQNGVAMDISANAMLAIGASPAMCSGEEESGEFMKKAGALSINIGALTTTRVKEIQLAIEAANAEGKPWCLDPVGCGGTASRTANAVKFMSMRPTVVRGNASEIISLACACFNIERTGAGVRGVDSTDLPSQAVPMAIRLALEYGSVIAVSGDVDMITDGTTVVTVKNGTPMLTKITAVGCSLSAIVAAFLAVSGGMHLEASVAACACVSVCGEGFPGGRGPAELRTFWIDGLYSLTPERLEEMANVSCDVVENPPSPAVSESRDILDIPKIWSECENAVLSCILHPFVVLSGEGEMKLEEIQTFQHRVLALIASIHPPPPADPTSESGAVFKFLEFLRSCAALPGAYALITSGVIRVHHQIFSTGNFPTLGSEDGLLTHVHDLERQASVEGRGMSLETACAYYNRALELQAELLDEAAAPPFMPERYAEGVARICKARGVTNMPPPRAAPRVPRVLIIAGSDSGGGAGIQADIKACEAMGVYSMTAISALTAQNTLGVQGVHAAPCEFLSLQIRSCLDDIGCDVIKTGMISSRMSVDSVMAAAGRPGLYTWVVDPVMISTSGHTLVDLDTVDAIRTNIFPLAHIITPNLPEASLLLGRKISTKEQMEEACVDLAAMGPKYILVKGGHTERSGLQDAWDVLYDSVSKTYHRFPAHMIESQNTHGTGCTLASAIAANIAKGINTVKAVSVAKQYVWDALMCASRLSIGGGHGPLHHAFKTADWRVSPNRLLASGVANASDVFCNRKKIDLSVYAVTDEACCKARGMSLVDSVDAALRGGATVIQLRLKNTSGGEMTRIAEEVVVICRTAGVPLLINDRVDVALAVDADGAHVGQDDIPCSAARAMLGPHKILGVSCKTPALAQKAQREGADYVGAGACFGTSTKDTSVIGLEGLKSVVKGCGIPVVAIGGINASNCDGTVLAGASGVAVVSAIFNQRDVAVATSEIKAAVESAKSAFKQ